jgi:hypothetical protein
MGAPSASVKCRICGRPSVRGAKLCDECVAAIKRARHLNTVTSEFLPPPGSGTRANLSFRAPRPSLRPRSAWWSWIPTKPAGWGALIAFSVFGAAVAGTAYLALQEIAEQEPKGQMPPAADLAGTHANVPPATIETPSQLTAAPAADDTVTQRTANSESVETPPSAEVGIVEPPQATPLPEKPPHKTATEIRKKPSTRAGNAASGEGDIRKAATAAPAAVVLAPAAAPAPEPPVPDRWETMNAALAACSREALLAGVMCTERVRYQYCEGFWGQVPQCRAATRPGSSH